VPEHSEDEAYAAIATAENVLRDLIEAELDLTNDADWYARSGLSSELLDKWKVKRVEEGKRRDGVVPSQRLVEYSELHDLQTVLKKNWHAFTACLGALRDTEVMLDRLSDFRIATMHGRALLPFERALAVGIAGQIRNQVTLYRSEAGSEADPFPRIEYIRDSFNNEWKNASPATFPLLHPGDEVEFEGAGWDPQGEDLTWSALVIAQLHVRLVDTTLGPGEILRFKWLVTEEQIGGPTWLWVQMRSQRPYHRKELDDDQVVMQYRVHPLGQ
jgi:hypothetical protein